MTNTAARCFTTLYIAIVGEASPELREARAALVAIHSSVVSVFHSYAGSGTETAATAMLVADSRAAADIQQTSAPNYWPCFVPSIDSC